MCAVADALRLRFSPRSCLPRCVPHGRAWRCVLSRHFRRTVPKPFPSCVEALTRLSWCGPVVTAPGRNYFTGPSSRRSPGPKLRAKLGISPATLCQWRHDFGRGGPCEIVAARSSDDRAAPRKPTHRQARLCGTHLGNMTRGRSRRASETAHTDAPTGFVHANAIRCTGSQGPCSYAPPRR